MADYLMGIGYGTGGAKEWAEYIDLTEPSQENHEKYMQYFALYKRIYEHVKDDFKELAELRDK